MNAAIVAVFVALTVATVNAGVTPLVASPLSAGLVSTGLIASPSLVASPWSAGVIGVPAPLAVSRSVIASPLAPIISPPAISPLVAAPVAAW